MTLHCNQRCFLSRFTTQVYLNAHAYYLFQECYSAQQLVRRQDKPLPNRAQEQITWPLPHTHTSVVFEQPLFYHYWKWLSSKVCICPVFLAECNLAIQSYLTFSV